LKPPLLEVAPEGTAAMVEPGTVAETIGLDWAAPPAPEETTVELPVLPAVVLVELVAPLTPGFWVISTSWEPSAMGPEGFAGHEPAGLRGALLPNGIVPVPPTAMPPTKVLGLSPWNWHWKSPLSSALRGADWQ